MPPTTIGCAPRHRPSHSGDVASLRRRGCSRNTSRSSAAADGAAGPAGTEVAAWGSLGAAAGSAESVGAPAAVAAAPPASHVASCAARSSSSTTRSDSFAKTHQCDGSWPHMRERPTGI
eukprot:750212-Prymnesium_polylepis.1